MQHLIPCTVATVSQCPHWQKAGLEPRCSDMRCGHLSHQAKCLFPQLGKRMKTEPKSPPHPLTQPGMCLAPETPPNPCAWRGASSQPPPDPRVCWAHSHCLAAACPAWPRAEQEAHQFCAMSISGHFLAGDFLDICSDGGSRRRLGAGGGSPRRMSCRF